jgi:serine/threonine-protein phosphatase 4 regulatory subunit 1
MFPSAHPPSYTPFSVKFITFKFKLPLFDNLRIDSISHVRHSALFALPAILSRLPQSQRSAIALDTLTSLSTDDAPAVRSAVLETLGEVLYTFHKDDGGPPTELLHLFLGRTEDRRVRDGQQPGPPALKESPLHSFYTDPGRPLICAFNYPSVALTLGRVRWTSDLREVYLQLAENRTVHVRRTLAASLGELAKIIGPENARRDLVGVWWDAIRCDEEEVRIKAVECVELFLTALGAAEVREDIVRGLLEVWEEGVFKGWRERETIAKALVGLTGLVGADRPAIIRGLLRKTLRDSVVAVRETAVAAVRPSSLIKPIL